MDFLRLRSIGQDGIRYHYKIGTEISRDREYITIQESSSRPNGGIINGLNGYYRYVYDIEYTRPTLVGAENIGNKYNSSEDPVSFFALHADAVCNNLPKADVEARLRASGPG